MSASLQGEREGDANISLRGKSGTSHQKIDWLHHHRTEHSPLNVPHLAIACVNGGEIEMLYLQETLITLKAQFPNLISFAILILSPTSHYWQFQQFTFESRFPLLRCGEVRYGTLSLHSFYLWVKKNTPLLSDMASRVGSPLTNGSSTHTIG